MKNFLGFISIVLISAALAGLGFLHAVTGKRVVNQLKPVPQSKLLMTCEGDMFDHAGHWTEMICTHRDGSHSTWKRVPDIQQVGSHFDPSQPAASTNSEKLEPKPVQINEDNNEDPRL